MRQLYCHRDRYEGPRKGRSALTVTFKQKFSSENYHFCSAGLQVFVQGGCVCRVYRDS